jgi:hypothetical protein
LRANGLRGILLDFRRDWRILKDTTRRPNVILSVSCYLSVVLVEIKRGIELRLASEQLRINSPGNALTALIK